MAGMYTPVRRLRRTEGRHARKQRRTGVAIHTSEKQTLQLVLKLGSHSLNCLGGSGLSHKTTAMNAFLRGAIRHMANK